MEYRKHSTVLFNLVAIVLVTGCSGDESAVRLAPDGGGSAGVAATGGAGNAGRTASGGANAARPDAAGPNLEPNVCGGRGFLPLPVASTSPSECPPCGPPTLIEGGGEACSGEGVVCMYEDIPRTGVQRFWARCTCTRTADSGAALAWDCGI